MPDFTESTFECHEKIQDGKTVYVITADSEEIATVNSPEYARLIVKAPRMFSMLSGIYYSGDNPDYDESIYELIVNVTENREVTEQELFDNALLSLVT